MKEKVEEQVKNYTQEDMDAIKDKYLRLYAEFENYKRRTSKEKEDLISSTKQRVLSTILDVDNDLNIAYTKMEKNKGIELILSKISSYLKSQGIEEVQTNEYVTDLHEVISVIENGKTNEIIDVVSKGYKIGDKIIRYPKVIIGK